MGGGGWAGAEEREKTGVRTVLLIFQGPALGGTSESCAQATERGGRWTADTCREPQAKGALGWEAGKLSRSDGNEVTSAGAGPNK